MSISSLALAGCYEVDYGPPPVTVVPTASSVPHYGPPMSNTNVPHYGPPAPPVTVTPNGSSRPYYGPPSNSAPSYGPPPGGNSVPSYGPAPETNSSEPHYGPAAQVASAPRVATYNAPEASGVIPVVKTSDRRRSASNRGNIINSAKVIAADKTNSLPDVK